MVVDVAVGMKGDVYSRTGGLNLNTTEPPIRRMNSSSDSNPVRIMSWQISGILEPEP